MRSSNKIRSNEYAALSGEPSIILTGAASMRANDSLQRRAMQFAAIHRRTGTIGKSVKNNFYGVTVAVPVADEVADVVGDRNSSCMFLMAKGGAALRFRVVFCISLRRLAPDRVTPGNAIKKKFHCTSISMQWQFLSRLKCISVSIAM